MEIRRPGHSRGSEDKTNVSHTRVDPSRDDRAIRTSIAQDQGNHGHQGEAHTAGAAREMHPGAIGSRQFV